MKNYAILRIKKIKSTGSLAASAAHNSREALTLNADPEIKNIHFGEKGKEGVLAKLNERLTGRGKIRKNAVLVVEYLISATPKKLNSMSKVEQTKFFQDSLTFISQKHGRDNILNASVHFDETTPHMHCTIVPIDEKGKLNARNFFGGREKMRELQSDFAEVVGKKYGLERGEIGSKSDHKTIKEFYGDIEKIKETKGEVKLTKLDFVKGLSGASEKINRLKQADNLLVTAALKIEELSEKSTKKDRLNTELRAEFSSIKKELVVAKSQINALSEHYHPTFVDSLKNDLREARYNLKIAETKMLATNINKGSKNGSTQQSKSTEQKVSLHLHR